MVTKMSLDSSRRAVNHDACQVAEEGIVVRSAFLGIVLVVVNQSAFAVQCLTPTEKIAFDVRALQTELMITALSCGRDNDYSAFVSSHQRDLAAAYDRITATGGYLPHRYRQCAVEGEGGEQPQLLQPDATPVVSSDATSDDGRYGASRHRMAPHQSPPARRVPRVTVPSSLMWTVHGMQALFHCSRRLLLVPSRAAVDRSRALGQCRL
jgi:hypothetical protein